MKMQKELICKIIKSHGGLINQVNQMQQERKEKYLKQLRAASNKANNK
jgi:hypothetical protein